MADPLILALETATADVSAALLRGSQLVAEGFAPAGRQAAAGLLPLVDDLLATAGLRLDDVEAFAVSIGPGSFTGLRIGAATLKGLAFGTSRPAVAVPTLEALARVAPAGAGPIVSALDARRGQLYAACFEPPSGPAGGPRGSLHAGAGWQRRLDDGVYTPDELAARVPRPCRVVGDGARVAQAALQEALGPACELLPPPEGRARAARVAEVAAERLASGAVGSPEELVPRYLRRPEPEVRRTGLRFEP